MPENLVSRDGLGSPATRQPVHLHIQTESGAYLRDFSRIPRRCPFIYLNRHTPSGQSRVYRVTQLRTDGVHCRESTGRWPVNVKVVVVVVSHIQRIGCQPEKTTSHGGQSRSGSTEQGKENKRESLAAYPPPPPTPPHCSFGEK